MNFLSTKKKLSFAIVKLFGTFRIVRAHYRRVKTDILLLSRKLKMQIQANDALKASKLIRDEICL